MFSSLSSLSIHAVAFVVLVIQIERLDWLVDMRSCCWDCLNSASKIKLIMAFIGQD